MQIEAGDLLLANIDWNVVEPLSEIIKANTKAGGDRRLTLFKSVGIALEDVAVAAYIYERLLLSGHLLIRVAPRADLQAAANPA